MPLTSLGVMPQYLEQVRKGATGPTPLDAIEARRASRAKEELDKYNSESDRLKALAAFKTSNTGAAAEAREQRLANMSQEAQAIIQQSFGSFPEGASDADMTAWLREGMRRALPYGNPEVGKWIASMAPILNSSVTTATPGTGTLAEANIGSQIGLRGAQAGLAEQQTQFYSGIPRSVAPDVSDAELTEVDKALNTQDNRPWYQFWGGLSEDERVKIAGEAKARQADYRAVGINKSIGEVSIEILKGESFRAAGGTPMGQPIGGGGTPEEDPDGLF